MAPFTAIAIAFVVACIALVVAVLLARRLERTRHGEGE